MPDTPAIDDTERAHRLEAHLVALAQHGTTTWPSTAMGAGGIGGSALCTEAHADVVAHLTHGALAGDTLTETADTYEAMWGEQAAEMTRLDEEPARTGRRGPDGRPAKAT